MTEIWKLGQIEGPYILGTHLALITDQDIILLGLRRLHSSIIAHIQICKPLNFVPIDDLSSPITQTL